MGKRKSCTAHRSLRASVERSWEVGWWTLLAVAVQNALSATRIDDDPNMLRGWAGALPPLGELLLADAPAESRLPMG